MTDRDLLTLIEQAYRAAGHPQVVSATRFDNGHTYGVKVVCADGSADYLTVADADGVLLSPRGR